MLARKSRRATTTRGYRDIVDASRYGTIAKIQLLRERGIIQGNDGRPHEFHRDDMLCHQQFLDLQVGDAMVFDLDLIGSAINVERVEPTKS